MTLLLQELSKKVVERWASLLIGPGMLFVAITAVAHHQGFGHGIDVRFLRRYVTQLTTDQANVDGAELLAIAAFATLGAAIVSLVIAATGRLVERAWIPTSAGRWVTLLTWWRIHHWSRMNTALANVMAEAGRVIAQDRLSGDTLAARHFPRAHRLRTRLDRYSEIRPDQPTWYAQRMAGVTRRITVRYGIALDLIWPHIWTMADSDSRADLQTVQENYASAARLAGWAVTYALLFPATGWWPAVPLAAILGTLARSRSRAAVDTLVPLVESMVDINLRPLADRLGVPCPGVFTSTAGTSLTALLAPEGRD